MICPFNRKHPGGFFLIFVLYVLTSGLVSADDDILELLHADKLQKITSQADNTTRAAAESYLHLTGNVHLKQGDVDIYSDEIYHYQDLDKLILSGRVRIDNDSVKVWCDEGEYNTDTKFLHVPDTILIHYNEKIFKAGALNGDLDKDIYTAYKGVDILDTVSVSTADSLIFDENAQLARLYHQAELADTVNNIHLKGEYLQYDMEKDLFYAFDKGSVFQLDNDLEKRFEVFADTVMGDVNGGWMTAWQNVYIEQDSSRAWSDSLVYVDSTETLELFSSSHARYRHIDLFADHMHLSFRQGHLDSLKAFLSPYATMTDSGYYGEIGDKKVKKVSHVKGRSMYLAFNRDDSPKVMDMVGMVTTDYHIFRDSIYTGINHMTSDTLRLEFKDEDVKEIFAIFEVDGIFTPDTSYEEMDTTVVYKTDEMRYDLEQDMMFVYPNADMTYGQINVAADTMKVDWKTNILYALPGPGGRLPEFVQGDDPPVKGKRFEYNLETSKGRVTRGKTNIKEGYYHGQDVIKLKEEPLYVENAVFTTCENDTPHFCFEAAKMKLIPGDRLFAQDIVFKIMDIPLAYAPGLFISIREGNRLSGWEIPHFGTYTTKGWALEDFGYYWAPNDYYDARLLFDFYDNYGMNVELRNRYAWRYHITTGNISFNYWNYFLKSSPSAGYNLSVNHTQKIGSKSSLNVNATFTNDSQHYEDELDKDKRLEQQIVSKGTYSTSLGAFSISANASRTEDLLTGNSTTELPQFSINKSSASLIRQSGSETKKWYHKFTYSMNSNLSNKMTHIYSDDDSLYVDNTKNKLQTSMNVRYSDKLLGFLTVAPYLNYAEKWTTRYYAPEMNAGGDSVLVDSSGTYAVEEIQGFKRRGEFNLGASASTTVYGVFNINMGPLKAIRHKMTSSLTYNYRPDQSDNPNYVFQGVGTDSSTISYDYFKNTLLGTTPSSESKTFNMSFSHTFEGKFKNKEGKEKKYTLLSASHSYNFLADSLNSSLVFLKSSIPDLPAGMNLVMSAYLDPYAYRINDDAATVTRINEFTLPRVKSLSLSSNYSISPGKAVSGKKNDEARQDSMGTDSLSRPENIVEKPQMGDMGFHKWSLSGGIRYTYNAGNPLSISNLLLINGVLKANFTEKWSGSYSINYNILDQTITDQRLKLTRNLHCWKFSLDWNVGYSIFATIQATGSLLEDLKLPLKNGDYY